MYASEHTQLINKFIGLCKKQKKWPTILADLGYDAQLIEQTINLKSAQKIKPDVIAVTNKYLHVIVADCKSGKNIEKEQEDRYHKLESKDMKYYVTVYDSERLKHTICYVDNSKNHHLLKPYTKYPFITFSKESIKADGSFDQNQLDSALATEISLEGMLEPTSYYPFSPEDEDYHIIPHVLRGLISFLSRKGKKNRPEIKAPGTALEVCKIIHPYYNNIETQHREKLVERVEEMIKVLMNSNENFNEQISKIEKGEFSSGTFKSLVKICENITTEYESQRKLTDFDYDVQNSISK